MSISAWIPFAEKRSEIIEIRCQATKKNCICDATYVSLSLSLAVCVDVSKWVEKNADKIVHYECAVDQSRMNPWKERRALSLQMSTKWIHLFGWLRVCGRFHVAPKRDMWIFALDTFCYSIKIVTAFLFQFHIVYFITNETDERFQRTDRNNDAEPKKRELHRNTDDEEGDGSRPKLSMIMLLSNKPSPSVVPNRLCINRKNSHGFHSEYRWTNKIT